VQSKISASSRVAALLKAQARKGIRPMRVANLLKKLGENQMSEKLSNDPLIQYLKKQAAVLEDNVDDMPVGTEEKPLVDEDPLPTQRLVDRGRVRQYLSDRFDEPEGIRKKFIEKEHEVEMD
jgi:hypothetical protein